MRDVGEACCVPCLDTAKGAHRLGDTAVILLFDLTDLCNLNDPVLGICTDTNRALIKCI
jgi:hypothetical protein